MSPYISIPPVGLLIDNTTGYKCNLTINIYCDILCNSNITDSKMGVVDNMKNWVRAIIFLLTILVFISGCRAESDNRAQVAQSIEKAEKVKYVVCIDAGHGFGDSGCESKYLNGLEKDVTLALAELLKAELEKIGVTVITTHNGQDFPRCETIRQKAQLYNISYDSERFIENNVFSAYERVIYACTLNKETPINLFVSLHINSIENHPEVNRYELYYYKNNPYAAQIAGLCGGLKDRLDNETEIFATSAYDSYTVTRYTDFPSLLIEAGYASNRSDAEKINSAQWRREFCQTLAAEIFAWLETERT